MRSFMLCTLSRTRGALHVASIRCRSSAYQVLLGTPEGNRSLGDSGVDGRIILK